MFCFIAKMSAGPHTSSSWTPILNPNSGDYDSRTPLHLAAAEGHDKAVQYLLSKGADVNILDRWGTTPLQDAVTQGHVSVAEQLLSTGGKMSAKLGAVNMCDGANEGDVRYLKLLIRCGIDPDVGDYDQRCPMHLAAAEGRLLAVSYLIGVSANPNATDRWGGRPMDDCVRGGTQRHLQCAKLLQCFGGKLGSLQGTPEGSEALAKIDALSMEDVRKVIKLLISQGLDSKKPQRATHQQVSVSVSDSLSLPRSHPPPLSLARFLSLSLSLSRARARSLSVSTQASFSRTGLFCRRCRAHLRHT
jgi:ankyrin repeat protein